MTFEWLNWVISEKRSISLLRGEPPCLSECLKKVISPSSQKVGEGNYGNHPSTQLFLPTTWHPVDDGQWILPLLLSRGTNSTLITNHTQKHPSGLELLLTKLKLPKEFIIDHWKHSNQLGHPILPILDFLWFPIWPIEAKTAPPTQTKSGFIKKRHLADDHRIISYHFSGGAPILSIQLQSSPYTNTW